MTKYDKKNGKLWLSQERYVQIYLRDSTRQVQIY